MLEYLKERRLVISGSGWSQSTLNPNISVLGLLISDGTGGGDFNRL
jgi:hypothetical protein